MPNQQKNDKIIKTGSTNKPAPRPNEQGSIMINAHFKIFDPKTKRVYVEGRA
jgi:hypothetical protein